MSLRVAAMNFLSTVACLGALYGCASDCDDLRAEATRVTEELGTCDAGDTCVIVASGSECLGGVLACGVAVPDYRAAEARSRAEKLAQESRDCEVCEAAKCGPTQSARCDTASRRCEQR